MDYFVGLDVGVEDTALCVVDIDGVVLLQTEVPTDPQAIANAVKPYRRTLRRTDWFEYARISSFNLFLLLLVYPISPNPN